jgi:hypothetical protein
MDKPCGRTGKGARVEAGRRGQSCRHPRRLYVLAELICGDHFDRLRQHRRTKNSPSRGRFRPRSSRTLGFRLPFPRTASTYSRSVLGATANLKLISCVGKGPVLPIAALCGSRAGSDRLPAWAVSPGREAQALDRAPELVSGHARVPLGGVKVLVAEELLDLA